MEIIYAFCESKKIRVPLFGYDKRKTLSITSPLDTIDKEE